MKQLLPCLQVRGPDNRQFRVGLSTSVQQTTTSNLAFQSVAYYGGNTAGSSSLDEIRLGTSYGVVTPTN